MSNSYIVKTLGCKANFYDSQLIEAELQRRGWKPCLDSNRASPELCIVNSCTVTDEADRQSRKTAARLSRENPNARVVITGCAAEIEPERMANSKGIHYVIGNRNKPDLVEMILREISENSAKGSTESDSGLGQILGGVQGYQQMLSRHPQDRDWYLDEGFLTPPVELEGHTAKTRAFLKIQEGCNAFCTYCIIPYGRGPSRSIKPGEVLRQIRELVEQGVREVVITGTNIGDYGTDWAAEDAKTSESLVELLRMIFENTALPRLRVSSLDPAEITPELTEMMRKEPRFCPHFHVSLQSPHPKILKLMKRKYGLPDVKSCLQRIAGIAAPLGGVFVGMDVITGFPGESGEDFEETCSLLEQLPWSRLHVFPYSERSGTPATRLPGAVPQDVRVQRARRLNELSMRRLKALYESVLEESLAMGVPIRDVLVERGAGGYSPNYLRVNLSSKQAQARANTILDFVPTHLEFDEAAGEVALAD